MLSRDTIERIISLLVPDGDYLTPQESESKYPVRNLNADAEVMRVPPSPTGFVHIGTIYASLINERIAHQSNGIFILRIEDTDKKREIEGSVDQIINSLKEFKIEYDEGPDTEGVYGPYFQSERQKIYLGYAIELLKNDRAYPCFATPEELLENTKSQQSQKVRPGYYGDWAIWRNKSEQEVIDALEQNRPFVLRFKSNGDHNKRIVYQDIFKGKMEVPENDLDVPLIKSDSSRLPTYHLAHVVDDYLMRVTKVFRSDEWLPSTALHIELSEALGHKPFTYGHFAPISIIGSEGGKRKLSKRKDDEADVRYWLEAGYPIEAIKAYLIGLANSNFDDWYKENPKKPLDDFKLSLEKLAASRAPLLDMAKLEDYAKEYIARLPFDEFYNQVVRFADSNFKTALEADPDYTRKVLNIERDGDKPRKDLAKFSEAVEHYGYFFDDLFENDFKEQGKKEFLNDQEEETIRNSLNNFINLYNSNDNQEVWFDNLKKAAEESGFATNNKEFKLNTNLYKGNTVDFARIIRVSLTGKNRTPDLWTIMNVMGEDRVKRRLLEN